MVERSDETIGQRLRRLRLERGLSQRDLSQRGVSYAYVSRIEHDTRTPSMKALRLLARTLEVTPEYLETGRQATDREERELALANAELRLRLEGRLEDTVPLERVLEDAIAAGDALAAARARAVLGLAAAHEGRPEDVVERLEPLLAESTSPAAHLCATLGRAYVDLGRHPEAVALFRRCVETAERSEPFDEPAYVRHATYLSYALSDSGDLRGAETVLAAALERVESSDDLYARVRVYWALARLEELEGRAAEALDNVRRAISLLEATEDTLHLARAHLLAAAIANTGRRTSAAADHLARAAAILVLTPSRADVAVLRTEEARHAVLAGRATDAAASARAALDLIGDGDPAQTGLALVALGEAQALEGALEDAEASLARATELLERSGRWRECAEALGARVRLARGAGREAEATELEERVRAAESRIPRLAPAQPPA